MEIDNEEKYFWNKQLNFTAGKEHAPSNLNLVTVICANPLLLNKEQSIQIMLDQSQAVLDLKVTEKFDLIGTDLL